MHAITKVLSVLVALEFLYIFYLETLATTSEKTSSVFGMTTEELSQKNVSKAAVVILMAYIVAVALYGSLTSNPKIILMQGGLAILTLISCIF